MTPDVTIGRSGVMFGPAPMRDANPYRQARFEFHLPFSFDRPSPILHARAMSKEANQPERPDWDTYFLEIAHVVARRSNCSRRHVAAVIVRDRRIISTGYNGTPRGIRNCFDGGCPRCAGDAASGEHLGDCICAHAEENAIVQAAYHGIAVRDGTLYSTLSPCLLCCKMIVNAGIKEVVYESEYRFSEQARSLLREAGIVCRSHPPGN